MGVVLLAGFVFRLPWLVPVLTVILAVGARRWARGPTCFTWGFRDLIVPRLPHVEASVPAVRRSGPRTRSLAGLGAVASLTFLVDIYVIGWLFVIAAALVAILAATTTSTSATGYSATTSTSSRS